MGAISSKVSKEPSQTIRREVAELHEVLTRWQKMIWAINGCKLILCAICADGGDNVQTALTIDSKQLV